MKTTLFLIRHAKAQGNLENRFQSRYNSELSEEGLKQTELLKEYFKNKKIDFVFYSPAIRAKQTAQITFSSRKIPLIEEQQLIERDLGILDGMCLKDAAKSFPEVTKLFNNEIADLDIPGLEKSYDLSKRALNIVEKIVSNNLGKNIAIVTHFFWIYFFLVEATKIDFNEIRKFKIPTSSVTTVYVIGDKRPFEYKLEEIGIIRHIQK
ncbi:MAG: histidine phosphatase family protein [Candidatus Diapherotrites archaeon]|nr:histidine phosphatase family protein [Candidatus Diapherotrites archaeon]